MGDRLTPLDAAFLELEQADESAHMHIGWAMTFDSGAPLRRVVPLVPDLDVLRDAIEGALSELQSLADSGSGPGGSTRSRRLRTASMRRPSKLTQVMVMPMARIQRPSGKLVIGP